ncbi:hypothetical protein HYX01_01130 [Candidatus Woesearchaeota archaeon]|nr:hypothetical protein [Candidatus Woesearchaeota archaeon]
MEKDIEKSYNELCKKFNLPKFKSIDEEFEISTLDTEKFLLSDILGKVAERLGFYIDVIGNLAHPDASSLSTMHEIRFFSDDEKSAMYKLFKKLMKYDRSIMELMLINDNSKNAEFLNHFFPEWIGLKKEILVFIKKIKESWEKDTTIEEDIGYLG